MSRNTQRAAVALRFTIVAAVTGIPGDSLDQLNSSQLPDGALVWVVSAQALYALNKTSTAAADSVIGAVVAPLNSPGRFVYVSGGHNALAAQFTSTGSISGTTAETQNTWVALPSGTNFYQSAPIGNFTLNTTTGVATYNGPSQRFLYTGVITVASAVAAQALEVALSLNGAFIGATTTILSAGAAGVPPTTANLPVQITTSAFIGMAAGNTIQLIARDDTASNNITISRASLTAIPA